MSISRLRKGTRTPSIVTGLGGGDGVRVAHLPRLAAHVHLDLVGDFHDHIFRDVLRREFGGGVVLECGEAGDAPLEILDGVFHEGVHNLPSSAHGRGGCRHGRRR